MSERQLVEDVPATAEAATLSPAPAAGVDLQRPAGVLELQRKAGNAAVGRVLARREADARPDWSTKAKAEATANATQARIRGDLVQHMLRHKSRIVRNTAELFAGSSPLLTLDAITERSDSAAELAKPTTPAWATPLNYAAFFTGTTENNTTFLDKNMIGTLSGTVMLVRGHDSSGKLQTLDEMAGTCTHEVSHWFVKQYGEMPDTDKDASSFDRYADEFRAYWVEHGSFPGLTGRKRAQAIRAHLVGTAADPASGYSELRKAYYAPGANPFAVKVDTLEGPLGYNLTNSKRLHALWILFQGVKGGTATVDEVILAIDALPIEERQEANGADLIKTCIDALAEDDRKRVRAALTVPATEEYRKEIKKIMSPGIRTFFRALISGKADDIKTAYKDMPIEDKRAVYQNPYFMVWVDHHVLDGRIRAAMFAVTTTGSTAQYDAMTDFLKTLDDAKAAADAGTLTDTPQAVIDAMAKLNERARWAFFSWESGTMEHMVDVLPKKVAWDIRERLRY